MNNYYVIYNILSQEIIDFKSSYVFSNYSSIFNIMKANLKNGDIILEIKDKCNGNIKGYENVLQCQKIIKNLCS